MLFLPGHHSAPTGPHVLPGHIETENIMRKILVGVTGTIAAIVLMVAPATSASALGGVHSGSTTHGVQMACSHCTVGF